VQGASGFHGKIALINEGGVVYAVWCRDYCAAIIGRLAVFVRFLRIFCTSDSDVGSPRSTGEFAFV
jgi:hypothetical protein